MLLMLAYSSLKALESGVRGSITTSFNELMIFKVRLVKDSPGYEDLINEAVAAAHKSADSDDCEDQLLWLRAGGRKRGIG